MKLKLTKAEMLSLTNLVKAVSQAYPQPTHTDLLIKTMLTRLWVELQQRTIILQPAYRLSWHPERAMAFLVAFEEVDLSKWPFEMALLLKITNQIRQLYPCSS